MKHNEDENVFCAAAFRESPPDCAAGMKNIFSPTKAVGAERLRVPRRVEKTRRRIFGDGRGDKFLQSALANLTAKNYHIVVDWRKCRVNFFMEVLLYGKFTAP